jgi:hypothetical protein
VLTVRATSRDLYFPPVNAPPKLRISCVERISVRCVDPFFSQLSHVRLIERARNE